MYVIGYKYEINEGSAKYIQMAVVHFTMPSLEMARLDHERVQGKFKICILRFAIPAKFGSASPVSVPLPDADIF